MSSYLKYFLTAAGLAVLTWHNAAGQVIFKAIPGKNKVGIHDTFALTYHFEGETIDRYEAPDFGPFRVVAQPSQSQTTQYRQKGDSVDSTVSVELTYYVQAQTTGRLPLPVAGIKGKSGRQYHSAPAVIEVVEGHTPDWIVLNDLATESDDGWNFITRISNVRGSKKFIVSAGSVFHASAAGTVFDLMQKTPPGPAFTADSLKIMKLLDTVDAYFLEQAQTERRATLIYHHEIRNFYNVDDTTGMSNALDRIYQSMGSGIRTATFIDESKNWNPLQERTRLQQYRDTWNDLHSLATYQEKQGKKVQRILFVVYFKDATQLQSYAAQAKTLGCVVDTIARNDSNPSYKEELCLAWKGSMEEQVLFPLELQLRELLKGANHTTTGTWGGLFDGTKPQH